MENITIKKIDYNTDLQIIKTFFEINCGNSFESFTYFKKRSYSVIKNHIVTNILFIDDKPVGYSHLDKDGEDIWFGICIGEGYKGKKLGEKLLKSTLEQTQENKIKIVLLSVYKDNTPAIKLYEKFGFKTYKENELSYFMIKEL